MLTRIITCSFVLLFLFGCAASQSTSQQVAPVKMKMETVNTQAYVLINYGPLSENIVAGKGVYIDGLLHMAQLPAGTEIYFLSELRVTLQQQADIYQFSLKVTDIIAQFQQAENLNRLEISAL